MIFENKYFFTAAISNKINSFYRLIIYINYKLITTRRIIGLKRTGKYTLDVKPFKEESGKYTILIKNVEPIANDPGKRVDQLMSFYSGDAPGACIGVMQNGKMIFSKSYGKANLTHNLDFELDMPTNIGSVSKQFTAMAILLLEKEGKLSLDDDVRKHIPEPPCSRLTAL